MHSIEESMNFNFNITFPKIPCYMIKIVQQNLDTNASSLLTDGVIKTRTQNEMKLKNKIDDNTKEDRAIKFPHFDSTKNEDKYN